MQKILIATTNPGKKKEILECFRDLKSKFEFVGLADLDPLPDVEEDGETFEANALVKAQHFAQISGLPTLGEDSGLLVSAFPDMFGVRTRRAFEAKDDMDWLTQFLEIMVPEEDRAAQFVSAMAYVDPRGGNDFVCEGTIKGEIVDFPQAPLEKGIPISAVFLPEGEDLVFSAMSKAQKATHSHRGYAAVKMVDYLKKL